MVSHVTVFGTHDCLSYPSIDGTSLQPQCVDQGTQPLFGSRTTSHQQWTVKETTRRHFLLKITSELDCLFTVRFPLGKDGVHKRDLQFVILKVSIEQIHPGTQSEEISVLQPIMIQFT